MGKHAMRYEYLTKQISNNGDLEDVLNKLGQEGWEAFGLVGPKNYGTSEHTYITFYFKRIKS